MTKSLRILHLEDNLMDAELIKSILRKEAPGCRIDSVQTRKGFQKALEEAGYDLILSDYSGPDFDGKTSLRFCKQNHPETPFIFVSGSMGEDTAIDSLLGGATDYVLKEKLKRLGPAVSRALREVKEREEKKSLEIKFLQAQKMEVVGQLAGGIAHDFNNLLSVIHGHLQLLLMRKNIDPELLESLRDMHLAAETAGNLTQQLLTISRKQPLRSVIMDVNLVVASLTKLLGRVIGGNIVLEAECLPEKLFVKADSGMLEQVIMNLVINARDAMPDGGRINLKSGKVEILEGDDTGINRRPGKFICLSVADTGTGIPAEIISVMFDPFFTTKEAGKGTGLGLATVYGIVKQHQGWLEVDTKLGEGTEFRVYLPELEASISSPEAKQELPALPGGNESILLVEADSPARKQARIFLEEKGYAVQDVGSVQAALAIPAQQVARFDLLLTDLILPDALPGPNLAELLKKKKPGLKVIYTTKYGVDPSSKDVPALPNRFFLPKPYERHSLIRAVRQCLDLKSEPAESTTE